MKKLEQLFLTVFPTAKIDQNFMELELNSFPEWDSLGNLNLLLAVEEFYGVRFASEEMSEIKSIRSLVIGLSKKGISVL